ncbi:TetR/AcrR family transcriptional regulator [Dokdonella sp.]|uniref:TetR/AcrR family transcriptional regulator n=1 Tax=Dokdonella sp. TaxID=2291710 RepID=UPI003C48385E
MKKNYHHGDLAPELLRAAEEELRENGVEAFSLRAVAKRAKVSHGAPAHHFKDAQGLLTALAGIGYERLVQVQDKRKRAAMADPKAQLLASGLGYIDFAEKNAALFRLMFSSERPDRSDARLATAANSAFHNLTVDVGSLLGSDPRSNPTAMRQVMASWAIAHGLADLMIVGRAERAMGFGSMKRKDRDEALADIMLRAITE